jgi:hypothetical protein
LGACSNKFAMANPVKSGTTGDKSRVGDSDFRVLFWGQEDEMWGGNQSWAQWRTEKRGLAQQAQQRRLSVSQVVLCVYTTVYLINFMSSGIKTAVEIVSHQNYMVTLIYLW